ncbi:hypothetical protein BC936DRAFT_145561 [Jimgerdemannia flammicorona]|uniref:MYND-type domain-containing protein n=1 Tax=Jimgerdemannia flammicorona TaxID=994334 RepID=A0A433D9Q8_9FUNG|nr:hypothetical protein BC936DRAFT_145561 [Jimgerdemannia flammicorona]
MDLDKLRPFSRFISDEELDTLDAYQLFDTLTVSLHSCPHHPLLWYNRARLLLKMGYNDQAAVDAERATNLTSSLSLKTVFILSKLYFTVLDKANLKRETAILQAETYYLYAQARTATPLRAECFLIALNALQNMKKIANDYPDFRAKAEQLEARVKKQYFDVLQGIKNAKLGEPDYEATAKYIDRPDMCGGRYPWDEWDARGRTARTDDLESLQALEKEYNDFLANLGASKIEMKFRYSETQPRDIQAGLFAKQPLRANEPVLHEKAAVQVNNRLPLSACQHCSTVCISIRTCPRCRTEVYCSDRCLKDADAAYHRVLCGRDRYVQPLVEWVQGGTTGPAIIPLYMVKLFAWAKQTKTPLLELPGLRRLHPWSPVSGNKTYIIPPFMRRLYTNVLTAVDVEPEEWLDFDYWIFDTVYRMLLVNIFEARGNPPNMHHQQRSWLYEAISWINHSCDGNCLVSHEEVKTRRAVREGEELTYAYCYRDLPKKTRQEKLYATYGFICACSACRADKGEGMKGGGCGREWGWRRLLEVGVGFSEDR